MSHTPFTAFLSGGRSLEWITSTTLLIHALTLSFPGDTLTISPSFQTFEKLGFDEALLTMILSAVALVRMAGLYINGKWRRSPLLRMCGAVVGAGIFASMAAVFVTPYLSGQQHALTTAVGTYLILALCDVLAAYRSASDARLSQ